MWTVYLNMKDSHFSQSIVPPFFAFSKRSLSDGNMRWIHLAGVPDNTASGVGSIPRRCLDGLVWKRQNALLNGRNRRDKAQWRGCSPNLWTVSKNQPRTHVVQDHTQCAHKCSIAVLDRHCCRGAARRDKTLKPPMHINSISLYSCLFFNPS